MISGILIIEIIIAVRDRLYKIYNPITNIKNIKTKPSRTVSLPEAIGLFLVLLVFLSIFLSKISFHAHPAALKINDPINKRIVYLKKSKNAGFAMITPHKQGHANNNAPVGLLNLPKMI
jgi:hypothetical protein